MATIVITDTGGKLFTMSVGVLTAEHTKTYFASVSTGGFIRVEQHGTDESDLFNPIHFSEIEVDGVTYATDYETVSALNEVIWLGAGAPTPPVPQINVQKDFICKNETWHIATTVYTNGVETSSTETDLGTPCDQPMPIEPKVEDVEVCDATTNTIHVLVNQYTYPDPTDLSIVVTTQVNDIDTGIPCGAEDRKQITEVSYCADLNGDGSEYDFVTEYQSRNIDTLAVTLKVVEDKTGTERPNAIITDDCKCPCECPSLWLLITELKGGEIISQFPTALKVGDITAGTHPSGVDAGNNITGFRTYAICSSAQPANDPDGKYWIAGSADDYTTFTMTRIAQDPIC